MKKFLIPLLALLLISAPLHAENNTAVEIEKRNSELQRLRDRIETLQQQISSRQEQQGHQQSQLRLIEQRISKLGQRINAQQSAIERQSQRMQAIRKRQQEINAELDHQRQILARQLRAAHRIGDQQALRLLFNQQDPATINRTLTLAGYLNRVRLGNIDQLTQLRREQLSLQQESEQLQQTLANAHAKLLEERDQLDKSRSTRQQAISALQRSLDSDQQKLAQMVQQQKQLELLLQSLGELLAQTPVPSPPAPQQAFAELKGKLTWPAHGRITARYNTSKGMGDLRWRGIIIRAPRGNKVYAVHDGQVVFSNWLQGFGNIIIVDHGDNYMSLYGHNDNLLKEAGDWITKGEVIATVGDTGGQQQSGLYFEIRRKGQPVNPASWLRKRSATASR